MDPNELDLSSSSKVRLQSGWMTPIETLESSGTEMRAAASSIINRQVRMLTKFLIETMFSECQASHRLEDWLRSPSYYIRS